MPEQPNTNRQVRLFLMPEAAPSILGLYGFAGATFMVAANMAGWYGNMHSGLYLFPFCAIFGGLAQFLAGMAAYRARDGVATAMHGLWGSFWMAYGIFWVMAASGAVPSPGMNFPEFGYWFAVLAAITWSGAIASSKASKSLFTVLLLLAAGSTLESIARFVGSAGVHIAAGYVLVGSAGVAWYTASALMFEGAFGTAKLPAGKSERLRTTQMTVPLNEPGVVRGQ